MTILDELLEKYPRAKNARNITEAIAHAVIIVVFWRSNNFGGGIGKRFVGESKQLLGYSRLSLGAELGCPCVFNAYSGLGNRLM